MRHQVSCRCTGLDTTYTADWTNRAGIDGREAFQEVDFTQLYEWDAKWVTEIRDPKRIPEILAHAFSVAMSGRPGPVVIALPEDMLREEVMLPPQLPHSAAVEQALPLSSWRGYLRCLQRPSRRS